MPIGSIENHGSHMGLGTDYIMPTKLVEMIEKEINILSLPTMPFGMADHHKHFPGTLSIGDEGVYLVMSRIAQQLYDIGARKIVFLNGHGGNTPALQRVGLKMHEQGALCAILDWWIIAGQINPEWKGGHASAQETSAMLVACPEAVHMELAQQFKGNDLSEDLTFAGGSNVFCDGIPIIVPRLVDAFSTTGWYGTDEINSANITWGQEMLEATAKFMVNFIHKFGRVSLENK